MRLINYFEQIYAVNLPERTDRRRYIEKELTKLTKNTVEKKPTIFPGLKFLEKGDFPKASVRGCVMSHYTILNIAKQNNFKNLLILQDDCCINRRFWKYEEDIVDELANTQWDIVYLGHGEKLQHKDFFTVADPTQPILLTHFCAFNKTVIPKLLWFMAELIERPKEFYEGRPMFLDGFMNAFRRRHPEVVTLLAAPSLGYQRSSRSDLSPKWFDSHPILCPITEKLRIFKNQFA